MKQKRGISRYLYTLVFLLLAVAVVTVTGSCGGGGGAGDGGGDGGGGGGGPTPLATGTFTKTADMGSTTYTGLLDADLYAHYQYLYLASNINGAGRITGLAIKYRSTMATAVTCPNATIKLSHSNLANLTGTFANNLGTGQGSQTTVLNNATMTFPAGAAGSWQTILLATPFDYNGKDNLIIDVERTGACSGIVFDDVNTAWPYTAGVWTTTNGSATGITAFWAANGKLVFAGGDNAVLYPNSAGNAIPLSTIATFQHAQMLHLASDINGSGPITGIAMISAEAPTDAAIYTVNIKIGHTSLSALTDTFANNFNSGSPVTVASALTFSVPAGVPAGSPIWLPLTGSFNYNGTDNLIVDIEVTSVSTSTFWAYDSTLAARRVYAAVGSATGTVGPGAYHTVFRFNGGTMDVMTNEGVNSAQVLGGLASGGQIQSLYRSAELGTGGAITSVSVRLRNDSVATSLTNYKLYIGHTTKTIYNIADTYASNMDENALAFSGTLNVAGGLKAGDWVTIPLSTPFAYDSTKNLSVLFTTDVGSVGNNIVRVGTSATQYPTRSVGRNDNAGATPGWTYDGITEVRFGISK